ncbi:MAG: gluconate 2-dehydrogenase subunit 3 family protein [Bryobacteraceae bacterium]
MSNNSDNGGITRRAVVATAALVPIAAIKTAAAATTSAFSPTQRRTLVAFIDRLVPKDETGPSASECGAAEYIDSSLGDFLAPEKPAFLAGIDAMDADAKRAHGAAFADLSADQQDALLVQAEKNSRPFFERVRRLTLEGMFSDPHYGGNQDFRGWDLIRYPGPRLAVSPAEQELKIPIKPVHMSPYGNKHGH